MLQTVINFYLTFWDIIVLILISIIVDADFRIGPEKKELKEKRDPREIDVFRRKEKDFEYDYTSYAASAKQSFKEMKEKDKEQEAKNDNMSDVKSQEEEDARISAYIAGGTFIIIILIFIFV